MCECRNVRNGKESGKCMHSDNATDNMVIYYMRESSGQECKGIQLLISEKDCKLVTQELDLLDYHLRPYAIIHRYGSNFTELTGICPEGYRFIRLMDFAEITDCAGILKLLLPLVFILDVEELTPWEIQDIMALQARISMLCQPDICSRARIQIHENFPDGIEITS